MFKITQERAAIDMCGRGSRIQKIIHEMPSILYFDQ